MASCVVIHDPVEMTFQKSDLTEGLVENVLSGGINATEFSYWKNIYQLRIYNNLTCNHPVPLACCAQVQGSGFRHTPW